MLKVDVYIEIDGNDEKTRYRMYDAIVEFMRKGNEAVTREVCGTEKASRDRIMLVALVSALGILVKPCEVTVHMKECRYVTETICRGRVYEWLANGWKTVRNDPIKYREEWEKVIGFMKQHKFAFDIKPEHAYSHVQQGYIRERKNNGIEYRQQALSEEGI